MAIPVAVIGFQLLRQALVGVGKAGAGARIAQKFGISNSLGNQIAKQYYSVVDKGKSVIKRGKSKQEFVSDAKNISVPTSSANVTRINNFKNSAEGQKLYTQSLNPGTRPNPATTGQGQGFFALARDAGRQGMGFLSSPTGLTVGGLGLLGYAGMDAANPDAAASLQQGTVSPDSQLVTVQNPDGSTSTRLMSTAGGGGSYRDQVRSGQIKLPMTEKSYNDFKTQLNNYRRESGTSSSDLGERFGNPLGFDDNDPRAKPEFAEEAALFELEQDQKGIDIAEKGETVNFKYNPGNAGKFDIAFNAVKDAEKQATTPNAPSFSVEDARKQILAGGGLTNQDTPEPRFGDKTGPNQFELVRGDDRNFFERTLGINEPGVYVRKIYDKETGTYKTPNVGDAAYQETTEESLLAGVENIPQSAFNIGKDVINARGEVIGPQGPITSTTVTPDITTQVAGPNGQMLLKDQPSIAGNISNQAQIFGLANYLNSLAQNNNTFMAQQPNFNTGFFARPPMQQFYGTRKPGLFDREFYGTRTGFF